MKKKKKASRGHKRKPDIVKKNGEIIRIYPLTKVETKIVKLLVGKAMSNKEVADEIGNSVRTVENHRHRLMRKLKTRNAIELTKKIIKMGLAKL
jgi:DNA-binding NarL/FixJ family response regulator